MENSHPGLDEGQFSLSFKWTDSTSLRLAQKDPFAAALLYEIESSVGLSREQSSSSEGLLFSASDVEESDNEEETDKQKKANLDTILDFVPCSQPDSDEGTSHHDHSPLKNLEDASVNRSGRPVRAASLGVAQYLVAAKEAASSRACVEAGPRGLRTKSQKRTVSQTAVRRSQAESCMPGSGVVQTSTQPAPPLTSRSLLLPQYVADFEKLPLRYLQGKDRRMSNVDRAVARILIGQITIHQVFRHHTTKSAVRARMTRLRNGLSTPGRKPSLPNSIEKALFEYVDEHVNAGMARYRDEVWEHAETLARRAKVPFTASWSWWRRYVKRWPKVAYRMKEATKLERLRAENPESVKRWFEKYVDTIGKLGITSKDQVAIIDEAGTFIGYGNRRKVVGTKGKKAGRGEREEREWISVLAGGTADGGQLPPCYLLRGGNVMGNLGEHGYAIRVPKAFNTHDGFREYMKSVLIPCLRPTAARPVLALTDGHRSRVDLEAIRFAREHHIHLFLLPPHTTHFLCPLDTHCFRPMKQVFVKVFDGHMNSYKSDMDRFVKEFGEVYNKGLTENNLRNGFADLGLWPPAWPKISEKLDGYRNREAMQKAEDDAQDAAIREELAVAAAERWMRKNRKR